MSRATFEYLAQLVSDRSSIVIDPSRHYLIESRLTPLLFEQGMNSLEDLIFALRRDRFSPLHRKVVDAITNNETWFFRDGYPFEALKEIVLPELLDRPVMQRTLRIWSAGSSSGQEIYSVAMLLCENFPRLMGWELSLLGTDISDAALGRAIKGRYSQWEVNRGLPSELLSKYFSPVGSEWQLSQTIRQMVSFQFLNLSEPWPATKPFDIVFLRNVLIYLSAESRKAIFQRMRQALRPGGYLFLGSAETTLNIDNRYERIPYHDSFYYRPKH
jgi:chemotaxis protein methyltransferase CheR